jgi:predicted nucleotidyltransferase
MDRSTTIAALQGYFAGRRDVVAAWLFGSVARGDARADSDVDIAVLFAEWRPRAIEDFDVVFSIQDDLEEQLRRRVDVIVANAAPLDLLHRVLVDGVLLRDTDIDRRREFELQVRTQYFDFLPLLLSYRAAVLQGA